MYNFGLIFIACCEIPRKLSVVHLIGKLIYFFLFGRGGGDLKKCTTYNSTYVQEGQTKVHLYRNTGNTTLFVSADFYKPRRRVRPRRPRRCYTVYYFLYSNNLNLKHTCMTCCCQLKGRGGSAAWGVLCLKFHPKCSKLVTVVHLGSQT